MQVEQLRARWRTHYAGACVRETLSFENGELVLGAGTVLAKADPVSPEDSDSRLKALLSIAYMRPVSRQALTHVKAATARWREGDASRAEIHLALSRLGRLDEPGEASRRLFMIDGLIRAGASPQAVLDALDFAGVDHPPMLKYSPDQPRIPTGNGRTSGEWTTSGAGTAAATPSNPAASMSSPVASRTAASPAHQDAQTAHPASSTARARPPSPERTQTQAAGAIKPIPQKKPGSVTGVAARTHAPGSAAMAGAIAAGRLGAGLDLEIMSDAALAAVARFVTGLVASGGVATAVAATGAVAVVGVLVIPNPEPQPKWIHVGGPNDLSYRINPDETALHLRYTTTDGAPRALVLSPGPGGDYRGPDGRVIARRIKAVATTSLVVSTTALLGDDQEEGGLCPTRVKDNGGELGTAYEDYAKARLNPENPTPHGMAYTYFDPATGQIVKIDDCDQKTGFPWEYKGPNYEIHFLKDDFVWHRMVDEMIKQSKDQLNSSKGKKLTWVFAEKGAANEIKRIFHEADDGREFIDIDVWPWPGK